MIFRWLKRIIPGLAALTSFLLLLLLIPRAWSALNPEKPPVGYYSEAPVYAAFWLEIEKIVNLKPDIPPGISQILS